MNNIQFKKNYSALIQPNYRVGTPAQQSGTQKTAPDGGDFASLYRNRISEAGQVTFSKHALQRMDSRNIEVSPQLMSRMNDTTQDRRSF